MSHLTDWLTKAGAEFTAIEHAAMHLIAAVATGATAHGIPVLTIEQMVLAAAKELTAVMGAVPESATPAA